MKSVLISVDFVKDENGNLIPLELNTNTVHEIRFNEHPLTTQNFESNLNDFFDHQGLHNFVTSNNINKIVLITSNSDGILFETFCQFYNLEFELIKLDVDQIIPDIEDDPNTLIIRTAYDTYALIDDLYARDNFEFHNLIVSESFASPVTFFSDLSLDTVYFQNAIQNDWPNYIVKSRTPAYNFSELPRLYQFQDEEELNGFKETLTDQDFLSKFFINSGSLSENNGRVSFYRNMSLVAGSELEVVDIINYKKYNEISIDNELLVYDSPISTESGELNKLHASRFIPYTKNVRSSTYHFDGADLILKGDNTLISGSDLIEFKDSTIVKTIDYTNDDKEMMTQGLNTADVNNFIFTTSSVGLISMKEKPGIFANVTAFHEEYGEFSWFDGEANPYFLQKSGSDLIQFSKIGAHEIGDYIYAFNVNTNEHIPLQITNIYYDLKEKDTYLMNLDPEPLFFVQITNDTYTTDTSPVFLIQHNACDQFLCHYSTGYTCGNSTCVDCHKQNPNCISCSGNLKTFCYV